MRTARLFARAAFMVALFGAAQIVPSMIGATEAHAAAKKKKPKKAKKAVAPATKKITAQSILRMHKSGMTDDEIVARAEAAGYKPSAKDRAVLKKGKAPKSLIAALDPAGAAEEPTLVAEAPKPINVRNLTAPNDIDFDDVAPPSGMPKQYTTQQNAPAKKQLDRSTRPSAPFDEKAEAAKASASASVASKPSSSSSSSATSAPVASSTGKRVVYKPTE